MATIRVVAGKSITAALDDAQPGDIVDIPGGVFKQRLSVNTAGVTLRPVVGGTVIVDGGYSHKAARKSGDSWDTLVYRPPTADENRPIISVQANGVTLDGLTVQNSGDSGISASGVAPGLEQDDRFDTRCRAQRTHETT